MKRLNKVRNGGLKTTVKFSILNKCNIIGSILPNCDKFFRIRIFICYD